MSFDMLERRRDPRTQAYLPIALYVDEEADRTPAHLVDLSSGGAAILTTAYHAPEIGQHLEVEFDAANSDGGTEESPQRQSAVVVNCSRPQRDVARIGVRFLQQRGMNTGLTNPDDLLSGHRKFPEGDTEHGERWCTARGFAATAQTVGAN